MTVCGYNGCCDRGTYSVSLTYGNEYTGKDGQLLFCENHHVALFSIYLNFKDNEKEVGGFVLKNPHLVTRLHWDMSHIKQAAQKIRNALDLRHRFQSVLKVAIGKGHAHWIKVLQDAYNVFMNTYAEMKHGGWWRVAAGGRVVSECNYIRTY